MPPESLRPRPRAPSFRIAYHPGDSFLHRLHPLVKVAWLGFGTLSVFALRNPWLVTAVVAMLLLGFPLAGVRLSQVRGTRLFFSTALVLGLIQVLFVGEGVALVEMGPVTVTTGGLLGGIYIAGRFLSVVLLSYLFVLSTEPNDLAYGLMRAGLPYRYGFALITALRMVPTFEQEGMIVDNAQLARGVEYDIRSPRRLVTLARQFLLPLLISALGKVDALAVSMEGRCFGKYPRRTFLRQVQISRTDCLAVAVLLLGIIARAVLVLMNR